MRMPGTSSLEDTFLRNQASLSYHSFDQQSSCTRHRVIKEKVRQQDHRIPLLLPRTCIAERIQKTCLSLVRLASSKASTRINLFQLVGQRESIK